MIQKIQVSNNILQEVVNQFVDYVKEEMNIDLNQDILVMEQVDDVNDASYEFFDDYKVYNKDLWEISQALDTEGYNVFENITQTCNAGIIDSLETLREYVMDR